MDVLLWVNGLVLVVGCGAFLRLVAKEKRRREKYLQLRLEEMIKEMKVGPKKKDDKDAEKGSDEEITAQVKEADTDSAEPAAEAA